jgi:hypothetical protein
LLGLLNPAFETDTKRKGLLPHVIQRRRRDVEKWLGSETSFPERVSSEERYELASEYRKLFEDVLEYCRETVEIGGTLKAAQQRVRHWAAIAILRCLLSSPAAAASVLDSRVDRMADAVSADKSCDEIDRTYAPQVMDAFGGEESPDYAPTAPLDMFGASWSDAEQRRLLRYRDRARDLRGPTADRKLARLVEVLKLLLSEGRRAIVFCRFIPTANYLQEWL